MGLVMGDLQSALVSGILKVTPIVKTIMRQLMKLIWVKIIFVVPLCFMEVRLRALGFIYAKSIGPTIWTLISLSERNGGYLWYNFHDKGDRQKQKPIYKLGMDFIHSEGFR